MITPHQLAILTAVHKYPDQRKNAIIEESQRQLVDPEIDERRWLGEMDWLVENKYLSYDSFQLNLTALGYRKLKANAQSLYKLAVQSL